MEHALPHLLNPIPLNTKRVIVDSTHCPDLEMGISYHDTKHALAVKNASIPIIPPTLYMFSPFKHGSDDRKLHE